MKLSVIIPTLERQKELRRCLNSILENSLRPDEVIIVEQGDREKTRKTLTSFKPKLNLKLLSLSLKSLTQARNLGIKKAKGELLFFIDDDVTLEQTYIEKATRYLSDHPQVMGLQGREALTDQKIRFYHLKLFILSCFNLDNFNPYNNILRSGMNTLKNNAPKIGNFHWLSGGLMTIRKKVFDEGLSFNQQLIRWSCCEDVWLTYKIYQRYGHGSLKFLPEISWNHFESQTNKIDNTEKVRMQIIYKYLFWIHEVYQKKKINLFCYLLAQVGALILDIYHHKFKNTSTMLSTYLYLLKNHKSVAKEEIDYNKFIFKK